MIERYAIIIGAMKAGTTSLVSHLARHPRIMAGYPKEPGYFAFDETFALGRGWYESLFAADGDAPKIALEGSTDYTKFPHCPNAAARIRSFGRDVRLIYVLRHPLRRIESHARHVQRTGKELGRIASPRDDHGLDAGVSPVSIDISRYAMQLDQYEDFFRDGRLLITSLERMTGKPRETIAEICAFLDIDPAPVDTDIAWENEATDVVRLKEQHALWRYAKSARPLRSVYRRILPGDMRARLRRYARPKRRIAGRFELTEIEEKQLMNLLSPDLARLKTVYGFDAESEWNLTLSH